ncbi:MAG: trypsin-like peptidase domain-containing protein [Planctomycetota bacterium]
MDFCLIPKANPFRIFCHSLLWAALLALGTSVIAQAQPTVKSATGKSAVDAANQPIKGRTFVALASGLERLEQGNAPASITELKLLEQQQSLVAKKIEDVTVNVQQNSAHGSGVIITPDGFVLTAAHVAGGSGRPATVNLSDGTRLRATTFGMNRNMDAGLLKINAGQRDGDWPYATLGKSSQLRQGQWVIASGHPGGWDQDRGAVIRVGRILRIQKSRDTKGKSKAHTITTDCALIGGDSGGPMFTLTGKLIGVHSRIGTDVEENMHVPIDVFGDSWERMVRKEVWGTLPGFQPYIGVEGKASTKQAIIGKLDLKGPAYRAGVRVGDKVTMMDGARISTFEELRMGVESKSPGETIMLQVQRKGEFFNYPIVVSVAEN